MLVTTPTFTRRNLSCLRIPRLSLQNFISQEEIDGILAEVQFKDKARKR